MSGNARYAAIARVAEAMLRSFGRNDVCLRLPAGVDTTDSPAYQDEPLAPVVCVSVPADTQVRRLSYELLVSATAVEALMEKRGADSAARMFNSAAGVVIGDRLHRIRSFAAKSPAARPASTASSSTSRSARRRFNLSSRAGAAGEGSAVRRLHAAVDKKQIPRRFAPRDDNF